MQIRRTAVALTSAAALSLGGVALATPSSAAPNNARQSGLINLALQDTNVQVPIGVAANICGVAANVLASANVVAPVNCTAEGVAVADNGAGGGGNDANQDGLVNVAIQETNVQVPVAVAANICGVAVNVLAQQNVVGRTTCEALGGAEANNA